MKEVPDKKLRVKTGDARYYYPEEYVVGLCAEYKAQIEELRLLLKDAESEIIQLQMLAGPNRL